MAAVANIDQLLTQMVQLNASDLHLTVGAPPVVRVRGHLQRFDGLQAMSADDTRDLLYRILSSEQQKRLEINRQLDFAHAIPGLARFRVNVFFQRETLGAAFRLIPNEIKSLEELGLSASLHQLSEKPRGLVLVTGPTGSGKSTTLAAMIDKINRERKGHIITVEDPIEFIHRHQGCIVNQREVGTDTKSFGNALKYALREDPDVVLIGELRDQETIAAALTIAETGHLAFATLHTNSATEAINRIIDVFPAHQQEQVRTQLRFVLEGIVTQTLLPRAKGRGRVMAAEILVMTPAIRALIKDAKIEQIPGMMQAGKKYGMQTLNDALYALYMAREVTLDECIRVSSEPNDFLRMIGQPPMEDGMPPIGGMGGAQRPMAAKR